MADDVVEHTLFVNRSVKVYRIPPRSAAGGHRSGEWRVADEIFTGRLRMLSIKQNVEIRLEDPSSGELFATCPFTPATQAVAVEPAADSSRYFVLRVEDPATKRHAFLGLGFSERGEAFDFNAAMADHARQCQRESMSQTAAAAAAPDGISPGASSSPAASSAAAAAAAAVAADPAFAALYKDPGDLSLKEGQTIKIDVHKRPGSSGGGFLSRATPGSGTGPGLSPDGSGKVLLPPPILPPPAASGSAGLTSPITAASTIGQQQQQQQTAAPAAVTVAAGEENWATFD